VPVDPEATSASFGDASTARRELREPRLGGIGEHVPAFRHEAYLQIRRACLRRGADISPAGPGTGPAVPPLVALLKGKPADGPRCVRRCGRGPVRWWHPRRCSIPDRRIASRSPQIRGRSPGQSPPHLRRSGTPVSRSHLSQAEGAPHLTSYSPPPARGYSPACFPCSGQRKRDAKIAPS